MTGDHSDMGFLREGPTELWGPSERGRRWLFLGIVALLIDLSLTVLCTILEFMHWGQAGLTPDVLVGYAAIIPQAVTVGAYLVLAREAEARGLWKSAAGMFASYLLISVLSLVALEVLPKVGTIATTILAAVGILALLVFLFSKYPRISSEVREAASDLKEPAESSGCWGHLIAIPVLLGIRLVIRNAKRWFPNIEFGADEWAILELLVLCIIAVVFAVWFSLAKIRLRRKLGGFAAVVGWTEILILLVHLGMVGVFLTIVVSAAAANPQLDDDGFAKLLDPWAKRGAILTTVCYGLWVLLTAFFFASVRKRSEPDWRTDFMTSN